MDGTLHWAKPSPLRLSPQPVRIYNGLTQNRGLAESVASATPLPLYGYCDASKASSWHSKTVPRAVGQVTTQISRVRPSPGTTIDQA